MLVTKPSMTAEALWAVRAAEEVIAVKSVKRR
jgi:hypothetical protein